jgi:hypothetical protein
LDRARDLASRHSIPLNSGVLVRSKEDLRHLKVQTPVVLKVISPDFPHKSDHGLVRVGLDTTAAITAAFDDLIAAARAANSDAKIGGIEVSPHVQGTCQLLLGGTTDPSLGPVVVVGLGGTQTELLQAVTTLVPPYTVKEARAALTRFPGHEVLMGYRGAPPADLDALATTLHNLGRLMIEEPDVQAIDLNPVIVGPDHPGGIAVDIRIQARGAERHGS